MLCHTISLWMYATVHMDVRAVYVCNTLLSYVTVKLG